MRINPSSVEKEKESPVGKVEVLGALWEASYTIEDYEKKVKRKVRDKYIDLALERGYEHYRISNAGEMGKAGLITSFYRGIKDFINEVGEFLIVFNLVSGKPVSIIFREIGGSTVLDNMIYTSFYGLDLMDEEFVFGDYIVLTEGVYDADVFRALYPNTIAMMTSSVSTMQAEMLSTFTDKFIIAFDNDKAGEAGTNSARKNLTKVRESNEVEVLKVFSEDKDLGEMEEKKGVLGALDARMEYYQNSLNILMGRGGLE